MAHKFADKSPYTGMGNNPVLYMDPDGKGKIIALDTKKESDQSIIAGAEKFV